MAPLNPTAIETRNLVKTFGEIRAVDNVHLNLQQGHFLALLGPSGCGKTTTLRLLAGFEPPDAGEITIAGQKVDGPGLHVPPEKRNVGMVFQEYALFPHLTVRDNIAYGLAKGVDKAQRVAEVLELVGLPHVLERMPFELSGGQQQRIALARALAPNPALILLDEPFSNLDAGLRKQVRAEVRQILRAAQATAIFVTHDQEEALSLADEVAVMIEGHVMQSGPPHKLYQRPATREVAAFLGDVNFLPGEMRGSRVACEVGDLPTQTVHTGKVEVMLRPEAVLLTDDATGDAEVISREYFGHTQLVTVRLPSGATLESRLLGTAGVFHVGQKVSVSVQGEVVVYPG